MCARATNAPIKMTQSKMAALIEMNKLNLKLSPKNNNELASMLMNLINFILILSSTLLISLQVVSSSPPIDFFVYTSQIQNAQLGTQSIESLLKPLETIYNISTTSNQQNQNQLSSNAQVLNLLSNSSHTHDNNLSNLQITSLAWHLMEDLALNYVQNKVKIEKPFVFELLKEAQVSLDCEVSILHWLDKLAMLDNWAVLMHNSWGALPASGLFEGTFTDLGSYKGCLRATGGGPQIGEPQYCMLDFQPLVPTRPRFHSIFKKILSVDEKNKLTAGDFDSARHSLNSMLSSHKFASSEHFPNLSENFKQQDLIQTNPRQAKRNILNSSNDDTNNNFNYSNSLGHSIGQNQVNSTDDCRETLKTQVSYSKFLFLSRSFWHAKF